MIQNNDFSESFKITKNFSTVVESTVITTEACYIGENPPHIRFDITADGQETPLYSSHNYILGDRECVVQSRRIPPLFKSGMTLTVFVEIPKGTTLYLKSIKSETASQFVPYSFIKQRHNAHLGLWGMAPDNTLSAFRLAAESGFRHCIAVPKVTKDGVIVCIHDDTINRTARDSDGNPPKETVKVSECTYNELLKWEYGSHKNIIYKGEKLPTLTEFLDICKETGMSPMFSTHPGLKDEKWKEVRRETDKRGLTSDFHIKGFGADILKQAYEVFSSDVDGYTLDSRTFSDSLTDELSSLCIDKTKCRLGIEIPFGKYTKEIAEHITGNGFFAAAYSIKQRSSEDYKRLISYGVTEFTEDLHCPLTDEW